MVRRGGRGGEQNAQEENLAEIKSPGKFEEKRKVTMKTQAGSKKVNKADIEVRKEWIDKIRQLPRILNDSVKGLDDDQLNTPYGRGKWTILQLVHHLADSHMNAFVRMKLIITEDNPTLKTYEQDDWARTHEARHYPLASSLNIIQGLHERWCNLLESLPENAWKRSAIHPESGNITLEQLLKIYAEHGELHVKRILELRKSKGW